MRDLTDDELGAVYTEAFGDRFLPARWENLTGYFRDGVVLFGRALLAKYGPDVDRKWDATIAKLMRDKERQAFVEGWYAREKANAQHKRVYHADLTDPESRWACDRIRDEAYPFPGPIDMPYFKGKPVSDCTREELLECVEYMTERHRRMIP